ncbi:MAG TPA: cobalt-precorrin-5B (C(1))-methyltransferase [Methanotrichaceae archaeon]|nr:cobalt-precorrin-5B (C(1))-methyltransferase [Methanotrichaceae archaeon]HQF15572.1 cobalt-precorrin-5B (C(1))-methyltransferase [Methanotrichaceae archaeon]HQI90308.1 cobalt-precorrin-5B (C(1))-methyltransferase [Methanotrichaceae archaeon]HQJ27725.1 cobalt-precorrin-5B (C(1))-methyltransferase [Methanotrichaceae archaeon]
MKARNAEPKEASSTGDGIKGYPLRDPVSGFSLPYEWAKRSGDPLVREKVLSGRWVLLSDGRILRRGLTTGTTAAAAAKAAILSLAKAVDRVDVPTPCGVRVTMDVQCQPGLCQAVKDGGDHEMDVTSGLVIAASAASAPHLELAFGRGVGRIQRRGLCDTPGRPAVSPTAREQILLSAAEALQTAGLPGARVEISVPQGEAAASRTLNPSLGIVGGLSILGSTGFVEPWNEHLESDCLQGLKREKKVIITTGRTGLRYSRILFPGHCAFLLGSKLDRLNLSPDQESVLLGLPGLILRWGDPALLEGTGYATVAEMMSIEPDHPALFSALESVRQKLPYTTVVLIDRDGKVILQAHPIDKGRKASSELSKEADG